MNHGIHNTIIGDAHGGKVIDRFPYGKHVGKFNKTYIRKRYM